MAGEHQGKERGEPEPVELFWLRFSVQVAVLFLDCSFVYDATTTAPPAHWSKCRQGNGLYQASSRRINVADTVTN